MNALAPRRAPWLLALLLCTAAPARAETVHLVPDDRASFSLRNLFSWVRPGHYYGERTLEIETTPPDALLDLFYVRASFQKRYEQAQAPVTVVLPRRVDAGPRDSVTVRAYLEGYRQREVSLRVRSGQERVLLELAPLPNTLRAIAHTYFGGRTSLTFLTDESPEVRLQEASGGFTVVLNETARAPELGEAIEQLRSPVVTGIAPRQLGDDLLVRVRLARPSDEFDLRRRSAHDPVRDLYAFSLDLVPPDGGAAAVERARASLARLGPRHVAGCALVFDAALRAGLEAAALTRALTPRGAFTDPFLRAAMRRLGEISPGGVIAFESGERYHPSRPIELSAAMSRSGQARGYLALLRTWVEAMERADWGGEALRSLVAPELAPTEFDGIRERAGARERDCRRRG